MPKASWSSWIKKGYLPRWVLPVQAARSSHLESC